MSEWVVFQVLWLVSTGMRDGIIDHIVLRQRPMHQIIAGILLDRQRSNWYPSEQSAWSGSLCKCDAADVQPVVANTPSAKQVQVTRYINQLARLRDTVIKQAYGIVFSLSSDQACLSHKHSKLSLH